jgi:hypothetical protein
MIKLQRGQRAFLAEKFGDLANIAGGGFIFGQTLSGGRILVRLPLVGAMAWAILTMLGVVLTIERSR